MPHVVSGLIIRAECGVRILRESKLEGDPCILRSECGLFPAQAVRPPRPSPGIPRTVAQMAPLLIDLRRFHGRNPRRAHSGLRRAVAGPRRSARAHDFGFPSRRFAGRHRRLEAPDRRYPAQRLLVVLIAPSGVAREDFRHPSEPPACAPITSDVAPPSLPCSLSPSACFASFLDRSLPYAAIYPPFWNLEQ